MSLQLLKLNMPVSSYVWIAPFVGQLHHNKFQTDLQ